MDVRVGSASGAVNWPEVFSAHRPRFVRFLARRIGDQATAEELLQTAMLKVMSAPAPSGNAMSWMYRVLRNAAVDELRRRSAESRAQERLTQLAPTEAGATEPEKHVCTCVLRVRAGLKPEYADITQRVLVDGQTTGEAAKALGITENNVGVRLHRARHALRQGVERTCGACAANGCTACHCDDPES